MLLLLTCHSTTVDSTGSFYDPVGTSNKVIYAWAQAFGALNCGAATAAAYLNGWYIGAHAQTGSCACSSCHASSTMESGTYNGGVPSYRYNAYNTIS